MASGYVAVEPDDVREIILLREKSSNYLPSIIKRVEQGDGLEFKCENMARSNDRPYSFELNSFLT